MRFDGCYRSSKKTGDCGFAVPVLSACCSPEGVFRVHFRYFYMAICGIYCADEVR